MRVDDIEGNLPLDGGDGLATVSLGDDDMTVLKALAGRTKSQDGSDPTTGADLGAGPGAGKVTDEDYGGASDMDDAKAKARELTPSS